MKNETLPCKSGEGAGREALDQAIALIQEAKGIAGDGAVTDHLDFAEHWLGKVEAAIEPILFRAALQGKVDGYTLPLSKEIARSVIDLPASSIERDIAALTPDATQTREAELRTGMLRAALCLSGFAGEGLTIDGFDDPAGVFCDLVKLLGLPDADDDDLRAALNARDAA